MDIDRKTLKALAADTRLDILKSLGGRRKTPSELSKELNLATSTIVEHLTKLEEADLVRREETGHKWIYYALTPKGEGLIKPKYPVNFIIVLSITVLIIFAASFITYTNYTNLGAVSLTIPFAEQTKTSLPEATGSITQNVTPTTGAGNQTAECSNNSECTTGGCSGQLCGKKGVIEKTITTCEWREEYGCLGLTKCLCIQNRCQWNQTQEYQQCLSNLSH